MTLTTRTTEKTYTLTFTENELAQIIQALSDDAGSLRTLAAEQPSGSEGQALAEALAEATEALRNRCCEAVKPWQDPIAHVPTDERWREEARNNA